MNLITESARDHHLDFPLMVKGGANVALVLAGCTAVTVSILLFMYILLESKARVLVPRSCWPFLSGLWFWPLLVPNYMKRRLCGRASFSDVGEGILIGATPLVIMGEVTELHQDGVRAVVNLQARKF